MVIFQPLGTNVLLPAFLIGYELDESRAFDEIPKGAKLPDWIVGVAQQAGGMSMRYPSVIGSLLRLTDNMDRFLNEPSFLIRGFRAMAEDPEIELLEKEFPDLRVLVQSRGENYSPAQLHTLDTFLARHLHVPLAISGFEAFVRFQSCDLVHFFGGWRKLQVTVGPNLRQLYPGFPDDYVDESNLDSVELRTDSLFDQNALRALGELGLLIHQPALSLFLLWENCD